MIILSLGHLGDEGLNMYFPFLVLGTFVTEKVDGTLVPPDGPESWPKNASRHQWLVFYRINEMSLQGGGVIDGKGEKWWNLPCKPHRVF